MTITLHDYLKFHITDSISPDGNSYILAFEFLLGARVFGDLGEILKTSFLQFIGNLLNQGSHGINEEDELEDRCEDFLHELQVCWGGLPGRSS
jgi:hypothetical protein